MNILIIILIVLALGIGLGINRLSILRIHKDASRSKEISSIMQHTLQASNNYVLRLDLKSRHAVNMYGNFLPGKGMGYEESLEYIHPEDRHLYQSFLRRLIQGAKTADCTFRWDRSFNKHEGNWRYIHDVGIAEFSDKKQKTPIGFFCTLTDRTDEIRQEQEEQMMTERYRQIFDLSLVGLAFVDKDGKLLTTNAKMREILKFKSEKDPFYYERTMFEFASFRDVIENRQVSELYFCTKTMVIERNVNCYTEIRVHPLYNDKQELELITLSFRDITQERELYVDNKMNEQIILHSNEEIVLYEKELQYLMEHIDMRFFRTDFEKKEVTFYKGMANPETKMGFDELIAHFVDDPFSQGLRDPYNFFNEPKSTLTNMHPFFHKDEDLQWNFIDSIPYFENGKQVGTYGVVRNVTDLIQKQERLKKETERANQSGIRKSAFMANMTHEIRTPLNAIVGFSDVLPMMSTPEEKKEIVRVIMNNCDILLRLVNDFLAVSALDSSGIEISPTEIDFAKKFDDIAKSLESRVQTPGVEFIKENPYDSYLTTLDGGRIQQIITNFVTNAIKYTHEGHIKIGYEQQERKGKNGLYMYCEDTGAGIPAEVQGIVFDRFVKLNDFVQGTGLGLSICKAIVDSCQGDIGVSSEGEGKGSTFWAWLPCERISN